jgi:Transglycosylase SLT domain
MLLFLEKVPGDSAAFAKGVKALASKYRINPNWLMALMNSESAGTFRADERNSLSGATGLIQFMPKTARDLGTTTDYLASLTNVQQLAWVDKYIAYTMKYLGISKIKDYDDLYLLIFWPAAVGQKDNYVIAKPDTITYRQNKGVDIKGNKDGTLTVSDFKSFIRTYIPKDQLWQFTRRNRYTILYWTIGGVVVCVVVWYAWHKGYFKKMYAHFSA